MVQTCVEDLPEVVENGEESDDPKQIGDADEGVACWFGKDAYPEEEATEVDGDEAEPGAAERGGFVGQENTGEEVGDNGKAKLEYPAVDEGLGGKGFDGGTGHVADCEEDEGCHEDGG